MSSVVLFSALAAIGVLTACIALALPAATRETDEFAIPGSGVVRSATLREKVNRPFEVLAERSSQRRRLNGGLTLSEHLARANLKLRPPEFVMIQVAFLIGGVTISLIRFGFGPQFVVSGVAAYLIPMRYVAYRQHKRLKALNRSEGLSILVAEQNSTVALRYADRATVLENGCAVLEGSAAELRSRDDVKAFYLGLGTPHRTSDLPRANVARVSEPGSR